ncbi:MAG TPA: threonine--tRNA ligase, partial [Sorangium sp.]|nr:threonine--tRNA ligase [Sorangium sp.]
MGASSRSGRTTARELLEELLAKDRQVVAACVDGRVVDLHTPIEVDPEVTVTPIRVNDDDALPIIRHSAAHIMADAVQQLFPGTKVTIGPATRAGFYYDFERSEGTFSEEDLGRIEEKMKTIAAGKHPFVREVVSRQQAHQLFADMGESYKRELIDAIAEGEEISLYRHGGDGSRWVDLCQGPHVPHTGFLKAVKLISVAG